MWILKDSFLHDDSFPFFNLVTTKDMGDMKEELNRENVCSMQNVDASLISFAKQVHGKHAAAVAISDAGKFFDSTDALVTCEKGLSLAVFTADCMPIFIGERDKVVAAIHAGWRGLKAGIITETVRLMSEKYGAEISRISASVGPHICRDCYSIGAEIREVFGLSEADMNFDLAGEAVVQLKAKGVKNITVSRNCTMHETGLFFSHRKDKTSARIMSLVRF